MTHQNLLEILIILYSDDHSRRPISMSALGHATTSIAVLGGKLSAGPGNKEMNVVRNRSGMAPRSHCCVDLHHMKNNHHRNEHEHLILIILLDVPTAYRK